MAVDQDLLDQIAATIADLYRDVETSLITLISDQLRKGIDAPNAEFKLDAITKLRAAAVAVYNRLQKTKSAAVREAIRTAYRSGHATALISLPLDKLVKADAKQALNQVPNAAVIENIAAALHRDLGRVDGNILRAPIDAYRAVQAGAAARIASGAYTRRQASQAAWQQLMNKGIASFTDSAGRQWRLSSYVEMIGRTNIARAAIQGQMDRLASVGIDLVYVSDNVQECKVCRPFESKVLRRDTGPTGKIQVEHAARDGEMVTVHVLDTLNGAKAKGFQHPNCRHSVSAFLPGITTLKKATADPDGDIARQKQRYLERKIRAAKEQALGALTPEAKKDATARVRAAQSALRAHLAAHPKLKRLPYREQIGAGNIPGPGWPKGGPITDRQPPATPDPEAVRKAEADKKAKAAAAAAKKAALAKAKAAAVEAARQAAEEEARRRAPGMRRGTRHRTNRDGLEWAKDRLPLPHLPENEKRAIRAYTGSDYKLLNAGLRGHPPTRADALEKYHQLIRDADAAFKRTPAPEPITVHRGTGSQYATALGADITDPQSMKGLVGKDFIEPGYWSTSVGNRAAFGGKIHLMVRVPAGHGAMNVMPISRFGESEREILLQRNSRYVIHAVYERDGIWHIEAEIVPDDWQKPANWFPDPYGDADEGYKGV